MNPTVLHERPLPGSLWLTDDIGCGTTVIDLTPALEREGVTHPFTVTDIFLNGVSLKFRILDPFTVTVSPRVPRQGDRLDILGVHDGALPAWAYDPSKALMAPTRHYPRPESAYGLQAPSIPKHIRTPATQHGTCALERP